MLDGHAAFGVLGPLSVRDEAGEHPIRSSYQRVLLAALLLRADRLVAAEELMDLIWEDEPPARPRQALQNHVMRVRQLLGPRLAERLLTLPTGYLFHADDTELDFRRFTEYRMLGQAAAAVGDWEGARTHLHAAFLLWRGEPLADIASTRLQSEQCEALRQEHLTAAPAAPPTGARPGTGALAAEPRPRSGAADRGETSLVPEPSFVPAGSAPTTVQPPETPGDPDTNGDTASSRLRRARRNRPTLGVYLAVIAAFLAGLAVARPLLGHPDQAISVEDPEPAVVKTAPDGG